MRIGIDVDGVLACFEKGAVNISRSQCGKPELGYRPGDWDWTDSGMSREEIKNMWEGILHQRSFWYNLENAPGFTADSLDNLQHAGHDLHFITTRYVKGGGIKPFEQTFDWLVERGVIYPSVIVTEEKGLIAEALHLDTFIDDKPENLIKVREARPKCKTYLLDAPWNQWYGDKVLYRRVPSFNAFADMILKGETKLASTVSS